MAKKKKSAGAGGGARRYSLQDNIAQSLERARLQRDELRADKARAKKMIPAIMNALPGLSGKDRRAARADIRALEKVLAAPLPSPQKDLAAKAGVSVRTIRRWGKGETVPAHVPEKALAVKRVKAEAAEVRREVRRRAVREGFPVPDLPVIPLGHRRVLNDYDAGGNVTGKRLSDWANWSVAHWDTQRIFDLLKWLRDTGRGDRMQIIYREKGNTHGKRGATAITSLEDWDDVELWEWLQEIESGISIEGDYTILFVAAIT